MKFIFLPVLITLLLSCSKKEMQKEKQTGNPYYDKAFKYREKGQSDSAFIYFFKAKDLFSQKKDSFGVGKCLINMAIVLTDKGDYYGGQETSIEAIKYLDESDKEQHYYLGTNFNNLGLASYHLKDFQHSLKFYDQAIKLSDDSLDTRVYLNNKATLYKELKNYNGALKIYSQVLEETNKDQREYSRVLSNIAKTRWLQNPNYNAKPEFVKALAIRIKESDLWGQNASYAHLADYYMQKQPDSALSYAHKMYAVARKIKSAADQLEALQKLIKLSPPKETRRYFETYQRLDDSVQTERNAAKNQFALIRYETEKNKAENLNLQKDVAEKKFQITRQKFLLFSTLFLVLAGMCVSIFWYKKRKQRLELKAQNTIRESQLKTSKKVHDVVANGLYRVMAEIENNNDLDKEDVLDKIDDLYEKSRNISYEDLPFDDRNFHDKISELLRSFATETTKVLLAGNSADLWQKVKSQVKYEIEHILQELMVNMRKHSDASNVVVRFEEKDGRINIYYTDNGIGIQEETQFKNGLKNTGNRIDSIHGAITFDRKTDKGLKIQISFPVT